MAVNPKKLSPADCASELRNGNCMKQKEFHRLYEAMPQDFKAELIDGTVYVAEPLGSPHGYGHSQLGTVFGVYRAATPGVQTADNVTVILGENDEVQPDLFLRISPQCHGQSCDTRAEGKVPYIKGAPELLAEIACSSRSIDLHLKKERYALSGVMEYLVVCLEPHEIFWFNLRNGQRLKTDAGGVFRSVVFPGLWIDRQALLTLDYRRSLEVLNLGLACPEHAAFVQHLAAAGR